MNIPQILTKLAERKDLTKKEVKFFLESIISGEVLPFQVAAFLMGLRTKDETEEEILGLIEGMRSHMIRVPSLLKNSIDTCGTGGDGIGTFNISTASSFVVAGAGVLVAKHGNRAASSKCGSADVLEALGIHISLTPTQAALVLKKVGMVFLFAPLFHPAMKNIAPIRKELGIRTVFNFLGPFLNPMGVKRQVIGVPNESIAKKLAHVAKSLNYEHLVICTSMSGIDEISTNDSTVLFEVKGKKMKRKIIHPRDFGIQKSSLTSILGGSKEQNAAIIKDILKGKKGAPRDIVVLNSAVSLYIAGKVKSPKEGIEEAITSIDSGRAYSVLNKLIAETNKYE